MNAPPSWNDNRPCDRFPPAFKKILYGSLSIVFAGLALFGDSMQIWLTRSVTVSLLFAAVWGPGLGAVVFLILELKEANMPVATAFLQDGMIWRTRSGRTRQAAYAEIREVSAAVWKGDWLNGVCQRCAVFLGGPFSMRAIWLTAKNKAMLDRAMGHDGAFPSAEKPLFGGAAWRRP